MLKLPTHRADAPAIFIHPEDDAWDRDRITEEAKGDDEHPMRMYWGGHTRYDLTPKVMGYLKPGSQPTKFYLRRLDYKQWGILHSKWVRGISAGERQPWEAYEYATEVGLERIEGGFELLDPPVDRVSHRDMQRLQDASSWDVQLIPEIGQAVYTVNMPLTEAEKKA